MEENIIEVIPTSDPMVDIVIENKSSINIEDIEIDNNLYKAKRLYLKEQRRLKSKNSKLLSRLFYRLATLCDIA